MRPCNSSYDINVGGAVTALIGGLREYGHEVECPTTGNVIVDGEECDSESFERAAVDWDGTEEGLEDLGWQPREIEGYTWLVDDGTWGDDVLIEVERTELGERAGRWLAKNEGPWLDITVRYTRDGEAAGIYEDLHNGSLQILGYSLPVPDAVNDLINRAWEYALDIPCDEEA